MRFLETKMFSEGKQVDVGMDPQKPTKMNAVCGSGGNEATVVCC